LSDFYKAENIGKDEDLSFDSVLFGQILSELSGDILQVIFVLFLVLQSE